MIWTAYCQACVHRLLKNWQLSLEILGDQQCRIKGNVVFRALQTQGEGLPHTTRSDAVSTDATLVI